MARSKGLFESPVSYMWCEICGVHITTEEQKAIDWFWQHLTAEGAYELYHELNDAHEAAPPNVILLCMKCHLDAMGIIAQSTT